MESGVHLYRNFSLGTCECGYEFVGENVRVSMLAGSVYADLYCPKCSETSRLLWLKVTGDTILAKKIRRIYGIDHEAKLYDIESFARAKHKLGNVMGDDDIDFIRRCLDEAIETRVRQ